MALSNRKRFQQTQIQPVKTRSSHDVTSGIAVLSGVAHRVESLESGYVEPALHSSRTVVRIGDKVGPVGGKSLDFGCASRLRKIHTVINRKRGTATEIRDAVQLPASEYCFGRARPTSRERQLPGGARHPAMARIKDGRAVLRLQVEWMQGQFRRKPRSDRIRSRSCSRHSPALLKSCTTW